jgi:hypothetical protein
LTPTEFKCLERNVYSQSGEDGVIEWLFRQIQPRHRVCVEFGAWDGHNLSNTFNLVEQSGWTAIYIEADARKFRALEKTPSIYPSITPVHCLVSAAGKDSLDCILRRRNVPEDFDLLSIDVDGSDYDIWEGMTQFRPALVVIEHNPSIPPGIKYIDRGGRTFMGSSATALTELALKKGYGLLGCTFGNSLFLREDLFDALSTRPQKVADAFDRVGTCNVYLNHAGEIVFSNDAVARRLRAVVYASFWKTFVRRLFRMPTLYVLGQSHAKENTFLRLLRRMTTLVRS